MWSAGDFVDRGSYSAEIILTLFALQLVYPNHVHLARGNHESKSMNQIYGFSGEVRFPPLIPALYPPAPGPLLALLCYIDVLPRPERALLYTPAVYLCAHELLLLCMRLSQIAPCCRSFLLCMRLCLSRTSA